MGEKSLNDGRFYPLHCPSSHTHFTLFYLSFPNIHCPPFQRKKEGYPLLNHIIWIHIFLSFLQTKTKYSSFFNQQYIYMAKLSIAIFFLLSTLSFARTPLTQPENDISDLKLPSSLLESDANPSTLNQFDKETQHVQDLPEPRAKKVKALPLTFVRLHPINRRFRIRSRHPFRLCDYHILHAHNLKPRTHLDQIPFRLCDYHILHAHNLKPRTHIDQIPYDKDMIHSSGENSDFENVVFHDRMPAIASDWISFLHHNQHQHDDDDVDDDDDEQKMSKFLINHDKISELKLKSQLFDPLDDEEEEDEEEDEDDNISAMQHEDHHTFDEKKLKKHFHHHDEEEKQEAEEHKEAPKEAKKTGSFIKRIRKFLDPYLD